MIAKSGHRIFGKDDAQSKCRRPVGFDSIRSGKALAVGDKERIMRRRLRKSIPFLLAISVGTMAGVLVAGFAMLASHS